MAFKLKGKSIVQGTSGHKAALKQREDRRKFELENLKREEAADKARKDEIKKSKTSDDLNDYLKKMEELLDRGISPKEAEQMLAENSKPLKQKKQKDETFEPAYPGADYSKEQIDKMTEEEKKRKIDGYEPKKSKGKIVYKNGKKYYQASDGTLHTGQVEDYERELEIDKANKPLKMKSPTKQKKSNLPPPPRPRRIAPEKPTSFGTQGFNRIISPEIKNREPEVFVRPEFDAYGFKMNPKKKTKVGKFLSKITKGKNKKKKKK